MVSYDFEVFKYDWMLVAIDLETELVYRIHNDVGKLKELTHTYTDDVWVGYNSKHYDKPILNTILDGLDPYENSTKLISGVPSYQLNITSDAILNYDTMIDMSKSLKQLEGMRGANIYECDIPFDIDRPLTPEEIEEVFKYCENDVWETAYYFLANIEEFKSKAWLIKEYDLPWEYIDKTKAQITAAILGCRKKYHDDEWNISVISSIDTGRYKLVESWFLNPDNHFYKAGNKKNELKYTVAGVEHIFGFGGVHGALPKYSGVSGDYLYIHVDVVSYYPRLMIKHGLLTRNAKYPERFEGIFNKRVELKAAGKKKEQAPLKIVINGTFGICKDANNNAYDPLRANLICINGQLMQVDLIDKLEQIESFSLIQSNTDGLIIRIHKSDFEQLDDICYEWERRNNMLLDFDFIDAIYQKDVNNYVFTDGDSVVAKGGQLKIMTEYDNNMAICNEAMREYLINRVPVEVTIRECKELWKFQSICKLTSKYDYIQVNGAPYQHKCVRVFASTDKADDGIFKIKDGRLNKFANTSEHVFVMNEDIRGADIPGKLDYNFYIELTERRLRAYG